MAKKTTKATPKAKPARKPARKATEPAATETQTTENIWATDGDHWKPIAEKLTALASAHHSGVIGGHEYRTEIQPIIESFSNGGRTEQMKLKIEGLAKKYL